MSKSDPHEMKEPDLGEKVNAGPATSKPVDVSKASVRQGSGGAKK